MHHETTTNTSTSTPEMDVGIDVGKHALDVALRPSGVAWHSANDEAGIAEVVAQLQAARPRRIVVEATGGLERVLVAGLPVAGLPVAVVNPRQVRDFAKATGRLAKTDALDAAVLAHFAAALQPIPRSSPSRAPCPAPRPSRWRDWSSGGAN